MIILSNSIPKTGSTLISNYQEDILKVFNSRSGQPILKNHYNGRYIDRPSIKVLLNLLKINVLHGSTIIKCHWPYHQKWNYYFMMMDIRMTITYRDPRDIILSMIDHGNRTRESGISDPTIGFANCFNVIETIPAIVTMMNQLKTWQEKRYVHSIKYEELIADPFHVLKNMLDFFRWKINDVDLKAIIELREKNKKKFIKF